MFSKVAILYVFRLLMLALVHNLIYVDFPFLFGFVCIQQIIDFNF
jgi:hypothetical protein